MSNHTRATGYDRIRHLKRALRDQGERCTTSDLLALSANNDPFYCGMPAQIAAAEWFADLWSRLGAEQGTHIRRVHYRLVSYGIIEKPDGTPYENTVEDWALLSNAAKFARHLGLVDPLAFDDRRNPPPVVHIEPAATPQPEACAEVFTDWRLPEVSGALEMPYWAVSRPSAYGYEYSPSDQPYHVELLCEKSTMNGELLPVCRELGLNLVTGLGFLSITATVQLLERVRASRKPARIFYIADHDPAGDGMPTAVARQIEFYRERLGVRREVTLDLLLMTTHDSRKSVKAGLTAVGTQRSAKMASPWSSEDGESRSR